MLKKNKAVKVSPILKFLKESSQGQNRKRYIDWIKICLTIPKWQTHYLCAHTNGHAVIVHFCCPKANQLNLFNKSCCQHSDFQLTRLFFAVIYNLFKTLWDIACCAACFWYHAFSWEIYNVLIWNMRIEKWGGFWEVKTFVSINYLSTLNHWTEN